MTSAPATLRRKAAALLRELGENTPHEREAERLAALLSPRRPPKKEIQRHPRPGKLTRKQLVDAVRPIVEARANGCSEYSGRAFGILEETAEWDEFFGRRPADVTVEKTWMLTRAEHRDKGHNTPSREYWDDAFRNHCRKYGYPVPSRFRRPAR